MLTDTEEHLSYVYFLPRGTHGAKMLSLLALFLTASIETSPRYILSRSVKENETSDALVMLHYDLWMQGVPGPGAESIFQLLKHNEARNYTASIGIGINHPPPSVNHAAKYYNSWGQQALQQQAASQYITHETPQTDGTGVNWVFHTELWPVLDKYFSTLSHLLFVQYEISPSTVKVIRIGMDKTGEFNFPYSSITGGGVTNNTWWAFDEGGRPFDGYPDILGSWRPGIPNSQRGNESAIFVDYYYSKLQSFQTYLVQLSLKYFPQAYPVRDHSRACTPD